MERLEGLESGELRVRANGGTRAIQPVGSTWLAYPFALKAASIEPLTILQPNLIGTSFTFVHSFPTTHTTYTVLSPDPFCHHSHRT